MKPVIVVDTREQEAFSFSGERIAVKRHALPAGDYSLEGFEDRIAVERKTLDDFVNTVIRGRERFRRELERLQSYEAACVVVEADMNDVIAGHYHSGVHPASILGALSSILVDYGIPVFFCSNRQVACQFTECYLLRFHRKVHSVCEAP
jgi:DNA excision repair protein ERCC-4